LESLPSLRLLVGALLTMLCVCGGILCLRLQLPLYSAQWCLVAYADCVFNLDTGVRTPVAEFNARRNGFCAKRFAVPFPSSFQLPRTIGILAKQGYSLYAVMVLFAFLGRLLFPLGRRDEWIQLLFLLGKSQTGKTTLYRLVSEGCMDPRDVRNLPSDPKYPLASLFSPPGARLWSNGKPTGARTWLHWSTATRCQASSFPTAMQPARQAMQAEA
jgi:hypothetical protein